MIDDVSCLTLHYERRTAKRRFGLIRVLFVAMGGRGRGPMMTWPLVNRICVSCVSGIEPPQVPSAAMLRFRVSEKLGYAMANESNALALLGNAQGITGGCGNGRQDGRAGVFRMTPE